MNMSKNGSKPKKVPAEHLTEGFGPWANAWCLDTGTTHGPGHRSVDHQAKTQKPGKNRGSPWMES